MSMKIAHVHREVYEKIHRNRPQVTWTSLIPLQLLKAEVGHQMFSSSVLKLNSTQFTDFLYLRQMTSLYSGLCNHHQIYVLNIFMTLKGNSTPVEVTVHFSISLSPYLPTVFLIDNYSPIFGLYGFIFSECFISMESYNMCSFLNFFN